MTRQWATGCAREATAWVFAFTGFSALPSASFHPNPEGQAVLGTGDRAGRDGGAGVLTPSDGAPLRGW